MLPMRTDVAGEMEEDGDGDGDNNIRPREGRGCCIFLLLLLECILAFANISLLICNLSQLQHQVSLKFPS